MANRITTWTSGQTLASADLNGEFNNIYTGTVDRTAGRWGSNDDIPVTFGSSQDCQLEWETAQTNDALVLGLGASRSLLIMEQADMGTDWGVAAQTNPSLFVMSADATSTTDYVQITHDQADGVINVGSGGLDIQLAGTVSTTLDSNGGWTITSQDAGVVPLTLDTQTAHTTNLQTWRMDGANQVRLFRDSDQLFLQIFAQDLGNDVAGPAVNVQRNNNAGAEGGAPGSLSLQSADGTAYFIWVDNTGDLRIHTAQPTGSTGTPTVDSESAGTIVGTQS